MRVTLLCIAVTLFPVFDIGAMSNSVLLISNVMNSLVPVIAQQTNVNETVEILFAQNKSDAPSKKEQCRRFQVCSPPPPSARLRQNRNDKSNEEGGTVPRKERRGCRKHTYCTPPQPAVRRTDTE